MKKPGIEKTAAALNGYILNVVTIQVSDATLTHLSHIKYHNPIKNCI